MGNKGKWVHFQRHTVQYRSQVNSHKPERRTSKNLRFDEVCVKAGRYGKKIDHNIFIHIDRYRFFSQIGLGGRTPNQNHLLLTGLSRITWQHMWLCAFKKQYMNTLLVQPLCKIVWCDWGTWLELLPKRHDCWERRHFWLHLIHTPPQYWLNINTLNSVHDASLHDVVGPLRLRLHLVIALRCFPPGTRLSSWGYSFHHSPFPSTNSGPAPCSRGPLWWLIQPLVSHIGCLWQGWDRITENIHTHCCHHSALSDGQKTVVCIHRLPETLECLYK